MKKTIAIGILSAVLGGCATTATSQKNLIERIKEEHSCVGIGKAANIDNISLAMDAAKNRARANYVRHCLDKNAARTGYAVGRALNVSYDPVRKIAIAYSP